MDTRGFHDEEARPRVVEGAWEALVSDYSGGVDYMRLDPRGKFVLVRTLQDDTTDKVPSGTALDPVLVILRVAEAIAVGLTFVKALGWELNTTKLGFAFKWTKLRGREIRSWAGSALMFRYAGGKAYDDEANSFVEVPADTPVTAIASFVDQATRPLFASFEGFTFPRQSVEKWVDGLIERKLP